MNLLLANIAGWIVSHKALVAGVVVVVFLVVVVVTFRSCDRSPSLDQKEIQKAQEAIAKEDRKVMIEVLANSKVQEQGIDNSVKAAEEATEAAKRDYSKLTNDQLAAELERKLQE